MQYWVRVQTDLLNHPKTVRAARRLGVPVPHLVGHLVCLWAWAALYASDGDLGDYDAEQIAYAAGWTGDPEAFLDALLTAGGPRAGFLEASPTWVRLHD